MKGCKLVIAAIVVSLLGGCAEHGGPLNKQAVGTLLGGIAGGAVGSNVGKGKGRTAGIIAGTLLGAALGNSVGSSLDKMDQQYYNNASQRALETAPSGQTTEWRNPDSGNYGTVTPVKTYEQSGRYCREYQQTIVVGGEKHQGYGRACRQPDGSWEIVD